MRGVRGSNCESIVACGGRTRPALCFSTTPSRRGSSPVLRSLGQQRVTLRQQPKPCIIGNTSSASSGTVLIEVLSSSLGEEANYRKYVFCAEKVTKKRSKLSLLKQNPPSTFVKKVVRVKMDQKMEFNFKMDESGIDLDFDFDFSVLNSEDDDTTMTTLINSNFYELKSKTVPDNQT